MEKSAGFPRPVMVAAGGPDSLIRGRVAIRASRNSNIQSRKEVGQGSSYRHCTVPQRANGYGYSTNMYGSISAVHGTRRVLRSRSST